MVIQVVISAQLICNLGLSVQLNPKGWRVCGVTGSDIRSALGSIISPNRVIVKDVKSCTYCCYIRCATFLGPKQAQLGLPDKRCAIKGLVVCNSWDLEPLDLLNGLAVGWYQPSPKVWLVWRPNSWWKTYDRYLICRYGFISAATLPLGYFGLSILMANFIKSMKIQLIS